MSWDFWFLTIGSVGNHSGWWFNDDYGINWIEFDSDVKSPNCQVCHKAWNWVKWNWACNYEIGWLSMLNTCLIDDWLDQFD